MPLRLRILSPCDEDWDAMAPDAEGRRRYCDKCELHVHDLSALPPSEAERLVERPDRLCVRFLQGSEGEVVHVTPDRRSSWITHAAAGLVLAGLAACTSHGEPAPLRMDESQTVRDSVPAYTVPLAATSGEAAQPCDPVPGDIFAQKPGRRLKPIKGDRVREREPEKKVELRGDSLGGGVGE